MSSLLELIQNFWNNLQTGQATHLGSWRYVLLWLLVIVEGPIATLLGAAAASAGFMRLGLVFVVASLGISPPTCCGTFWDMRARSNGCYAMAAG